MFGYFFYNLVRILSNLMRIDGTLKSWNDERGFGILELKRKRGVSFEEILSAVEQGGLLLTVEHPNNKRYPNQRIWVVSLRGYAHMVPFVETDDEVFLNAIMPSRKATKQYLSEENDE